MNIPDSGNSYRLTTNKKVRTNQKIYIVDDDKVINSLIRNYLLEKGFVNIVSCYTGESLFNHLRTDEKAIVIQDIDLPGMDGLQVLKKAHTGYPLIEFIFLSGQNNIQVAIEAIKQGAFDYIVKDKFAPENVIVKIQNLNTIQLLEWKKKIFSISLIVSALILLITLIGLLLFH